ncbi:MAG: cytidylate kinase-like family protein [Chlorobi bacterium]|nr:cytidylate kinase-like family protein [Chlorobiota bacterium]
MPVDITRYAIERLRERETRKSQAGPVITISREYGCPSKIIAGELTKVIRSESKKKDRTKWHWVSKEILQEAASSLGMTPREIKYVFEYKEHTVFDEILVAQSKRYYHSDKKIRKTISEVIRALGWEGHVIIVGRAGVAITREIEKSLHVRLMAPKRWRTVQVAKNHNISPAEATKLIDEMDTKRRKFMEYYLKSSPGIDLFDIVLNCSTLSVQEIVRFIFLLAEEKKLV